MFCGGDSMSTVNERIRILRKEKKISQLVIANVLNISVQAYSMKERGKRPLYSCELEVIAAQLKVPVSNFFEN